MENNEKPDYKGLNLETYPSGRWPLRSTVELIKELNLCTMAIVSNTVHDARPASHAELMWIHDAAQWMYKHPYRTTLRNHKQAQALINNFNRRFL